MEAETYSKVDSSLFKQLPGVSDYVIRANKLDIAAMFIMQFSQAFCVFTDQTFLKPPGGCHYIIGEWFEWFSRFICMVKGVGGISTMKQPSC